MKNHKTGTREEWLAARLDLLKAEKEFTRRSDELARKRQALPWVKINKQYRFETDEGSASLADLFRGRSQLLIYHFMFGPDYKAGCATCSTIADGFNGFAIHLANHDVMLCAVSRAPLAKLQAYKRRMGWTFPWASSFGGDFNADFNVSFTEEEQQREGGIEYNYRREPAWQVRDDGGMVNRMSGNPVGDNAFMAGTDVARDIRERPGMSAFVLEDGVVYHTYSSYARGLDGLWSMYQWLDRTPKGATRRKASGGAASTSTVRFPKTPVLVAMQRRRTHEHSWLPNCDAGPQRHSSARVAMAPWRCDHRLARSRRDAGATAEVPRLCGGVRGARHWPRHVHVNRCAVADAVGDVMHCVVGVRCIKALAALDGTRSRLALISHRMRLRGASYNR